MSGSARRGRSTASTARNHSTSKTSRLDMIYLERRRPLAEPHRRLAARPSLSTPPCLQAHDEICPKYPMICEGCAKKKIPREKVRPTFFSPAQLLSPGLVFLVASRGSQRGAAPQRVVLSATGWRLDLKIFSLYLPPSFHLDWKNETRNLHNSDKNTPPETHRHLPLPSPSPHRWQQKHFFLFVCVYCTASWKSECFSLWTQILKTKVENHFFLMMRRVVSSMWTTSSSAANSEPRVDSTWWDVICP